MRYAKIKPNDVINGKGISVSLFTQGCPHESGGGHFHGEPPEFPAKQEMT